MTDRLIRTAAIALAFAPAMVRAQQHRPLDDYVAYGITHNLGRRQQELAVVRSEAAVREARARYLPSATLNARYSRATGNVVDLGSLVNPAFGALNQILQKPAFPTNLDIRLPLMQETTVRFTQPVFQPAIIQAQRIASSVADASAAQRDVYVRRLAADIRSGYLHFAKAHRLVELYESTLPLLDEHVRVSERLVAAGKATPDLVLRARAERSEIVQRRDEAAQLADAARESFNHLLGRSLDAPVELIADSLLGFDSIPPRAVVERRAHDGREELRQVDHARRAAVGQLRLAQSSFLPSLSLAVDYGVQGQRYRFGARDDFAIASVVLSWNVFNGGQDAARSQEAALDVERLETQRTDLERAIDLDVRQSWSAATVAKSAIATASDRLASARRTFDLVRRRRDEGVASALEFLDARAAFTSAALNEVITTYDYYLRFVELERAAVLYPRSLDADARIP